MATTSQAPSGAPGTAPAIVALDELERLVRHLGEELAFFRRRALDAERRVRELSALAVVAAPGAAAATVVTSGSTGDGARLAELEAENTDLRARLAEAAERTRAMTDRMRFLRQQQEIDGER